MRTADYPIAAGADLRAVRERIRDVVLARGAAQDALLMGQ
ncbi:Lipoprotein OS=Streptomyces fumanus OX=67302 GN=GCM10018772_56400 PE=3 SV=1 [Streptomyces fumanus]